VSDCTEIKQALNLKSMKMDCHTFSKSRAYSFIMFSVIIISDVVNYSPGKNTHSTESDSSVLTCYMHNAPKAKMSRPRPLLRTRPKTVVVHAIDMKICPRGIT